MNHFRTSCACAVFALLLAACATQASIVEFELSSEYTGGTAPSLPPPWLTATLDDGGTPGSVALTLANTNLAGEEFVSEWSFNLDPALDVTALLFSAPAKTGLMDDPTIGLSADAYKGAGDGYFDILIDFATSNNDNNRFGAGESVDFTITGIPTLTAASFDFLSTFPLEKKTSLPTAAHIQAIGSESGWVSTPEPSSLVLLSVMAVFTARRRRRRT